MENDGIAPLPLLSFLRLLCYPRSRDHGDQVGEERGTTDVWRGITERGGGEGDPNGQSDERCAIIASAKIGSRQDAAGGNITFRGGAQKP